MKRFTPLSTLLVLILLVISCSPGTTGPVTPDIPASNDLTPTADISGERSTQLWGLWDVRWDETSGEFEVAPVRHAEMACNVIKFINGPPSALTVNIISIDHQIDYTDLSVDVGLRHPFPGLNRYTGFDVMGVFMGDGSDTIPGENLPVPGENDQRLLNADGYTRWFNPTEFFDAGLEMPLQGWIPGARGWPDYIPTSVLNGYKYFADGLNQDRDEFDFLLTYAAGRGSFKPGNINHRRYEIRFPVGRNQFQYAVIANWEPNESYPDPPLNLDDFPITANAQEAVVLSVVDSSTLYYVDPTTFGGSVVLDITPWDWSAEPVAGEMQEYRIKCLTSPLGIPYEVDMTPIASGEHNYTYHAEFPVRMLQSNEPFRVWIEVYYPDYDYTSPVGVGNLASGALAAYHLVYIDVNDQPPGDYSITVLQPNGGEYLQIGSDYEIKWESEGTINNVRIDLSTDGGSTYATEIVASTPNDGSFDWTVPDSPTSEARIRVEALDVPGVMDESDENFTIWAFSGNYIYGFADSQQFEHVYEADNATLFTNMLNLPLEGPYADNNIVMYYEPHTTGYKSFPDFQQLVEDLGYTYLYVENNPFVPLDTEGVKMLIIVTFFSTDIEYSPEEIAEIEELLDGGGICIILIDHPGCYSQHGYAVVDKLLVDLGAGFSVWHDQREISEYVFTDITDDPITAGVDEWYGIDTAFFEIIGNGTSLIRSDESGRTVVCKSPWY
jgi:hypothetical protein